MSVTVHLHRLNWDAWVAAATTLRQGWIDDDVERVRPLLSAADADALRVVQYTPGWLGRLLGSKPGTAWEPSIEDVTRGVVSELSLQTTWCQLFEGEALVAALEGAGAPEASEILRTALAKGYDPQDDEPVHPNVEGLALLAPAACRVVAEAVKVHFPEDGPGPGRVLRQGFMHCEDAEGIALVTDV